MEFLKLISVGLGQINALAYHVNLKLAICGTSEEALALMDISETSPNIVKVAGFKSPIRHVSVDQEQSVAYAVARSGTLSRIDLSHKVATHFVRQNDFHPRFLRVGRNSPMIILAGTSGQIQFRSKDDLSPVCEELTIQCEIRDCLWNEQKNVLVVGGDRGEMFLIQEMDSSPKIIILERGERMVSGLLPDNSDPESFLVLFESGYLERVRYDGKGRQRSSATFPSRSYGLVALSEERILVSTERDGPYAISQDGATKQLPFHELSTDVGFFAAADGQLVVSLGYNGVMEVWNSATGETVFTLPTTKSPPVRLFSTGDPEIFLVGFEDESLGVVHITPQFDTKQAPFLAIETMIASADSESVMVVAKDEGKRSIDSSLNLSEQIDIKAYQLIDLTSRQTFYTAQNMEIESIHEDDGKDMPQRPGVVINQEGFSRNEFFFSIGGAYAFSDDFRFIAVSSGSDDSSMSVHSLGNECFDQVCESDWRSYREILFSPDGDLVVARQCGNIDVFKRQSGHHWIRFSDECIYKCILDGFLNNDTVIVRHESGEILMLRLNASEAISVGCIPDYTAHAIFVRNTDYYLIYTLKGDFEKMSLIIDGDDAVTEGVFSQLEVELDPDTAPPSMLNLYKKIYGVNNAYHHVWKKGNNPAHLDHWSFELKGEQLEGDCPKIFCSADFPISSEYFIANGLESSFPSTKSEDSADTKQFQVVAHELYHLFQSLTLSGVFNHVRSAQRIQDERLTAAVFLLRSSQTMLKDETLIGWYDRICTAEIGRNALEYLNDYFEQFLAFSGKRDRAPFMSLVEGSAVVFEHIASGKLIYLPQLEIDIKDETYTSAIRLYIEAGGKSALGFLFVAETALHYGQVSYRDRGASIGIVTPWDVFDFLLENIEYFEVGLTHALKDLQDNWDIAIERCHIWLEALRNAVTGRFSIIGVDQIDAKDEDHLLANALKVFNKKISFASSGMGVIYLLFHSKSRESFINLIIDDLISYEVNHDYLGGMSPEQLRILYRSLREHDAYILGARHIFCCQEGGYQPRGSIDSCNKDDSTYNVLNRFFRKTIEELHNE